MEFPSELKYTKEHEWVRTNGNIVEVGITEFAQSELGDIVFVELPEIDSEVTANEKFGEVESVKTVSDLFSPVSGKVVEVNENLEAEPEKVNEDPYGAGWMIKIELSNPDEVAGLMSSDDYAAQVS
ncbi:MAG: glycine cleavage system protein GcvH [Nitrospinae bacterium]|nr:glycine cleavage system protein GcvH [Nitrospinota bacterium]